MENTNGKVIVYACEDCEKNYIKFFSKKEDAEKYIRDNPRRYCDIKLYSISDGDTIEILAEY